MKSSRFCPASFQPDDKLIKWACDTFRIDEKEVMRQLELMKDHEFRRPYSCWKRVFRNWMRKADQIGLKRERVYAEPQELTDDQRQQDIEKWEADMRRLKVVK